MLPYHQITKDHLKAVLVGEKKLLKMSEVRFINAPIFNEIAVKHLYDDVSKLPLLKDYFPDKFPKGA